jgi:MFS transporter, DHA2 family, multidrug resistance protein
VLLPLFVQMMLGYTATDAGLVISPGGFAIMGIMPLVGALVARVDARILIVFGLVTASFSLFRMTGFDLDIDYATVAWARVYQSLGLAFLFIPINTVAFLGLPPAKSNNASAIINMMRNVGGSFGIALATTMLARRQQWHQNILVAHVSPFSSNYDAMIQSLQQAFLAQSASATDALAQAQAALYAMVQKQASMLAFIDTFWVMGAIFLALVPMVLLMRKPQAGGPGPPAH